MEKSVVIIGASGHGRVILDLCRETGRTVEGWIDPAFPPGTLIDDAPVLGDDRLLAAPGFCAGFDFIVGIGHQAPRRRMAMAVREAGGRLAVAIHPAAFVSKSARLGGGTVVMAGAVVNTGSVLGDFVIINTGATIDHDNHLGHGTQVGPGAHLAGDVTCGEDVMIGLGAAVLRGLSIGGAAVVGAGATVTEDVPPGITVVGTPARPQR